METPSAAEEPAESVSPPLPPPPETALGAANADLGAGGAREESETEATVARRFSNQVDEMISKADELEQRVQELSDFYEHKKKPKNLKWISSCLKDKADEVRRQAACSRRMQEVMSQFGTILKELSAHEWAEPFLEPVEVERLGLDDYYEIIKRPMDFSTIRKKMEANLYKNVREIYADVRLVFSNAMTYNEEKSDIHVMAKTLLRKFEERWVDLLFEVVEAEERQKYEEEQALTNMLIAQEAAIAKLASDTNNELNKLNLHVEELRESVMQRCRKMSTTEKRKLSSGLTSLCPDYLYKALEIIAQGNPNFQDSAEEVDIDIDAQSEITLWRLKFLVKEGLEKQTKNSSTKTKKQSVNADDISKRKKVISDALARTRRSKRLSPPS